MSTVACIFGSRSVEHEVSVITAQQAMAALRGQHRALPVYIAKDGRWLVGEALSDLGRFTDIDRLVAECMTVTPLVDPTRQGLTLLPVDPPRRARFGRAPGTETVVADVAMPLVHGGNGEDGTLQGLLELAGVAYTGSGVAASAVAMDKRLAKLVLRAAGLPVLDDVEVTRSAWRADPAATLAHVESLAPYPLFVKPVTLGSSIGVARVTSSTELRTAIETALVYDRRCLVEAAQDGIVEVNCAVLGDGAVARPSLLEQPTKRGLLSYDDKYRSKSGTSAGMKSAQRLVPAPLDDALTRSLRECAVDAFAAVGCAGVARVDFMVDTATGTFLVNEINPLPGSLSFYLFEPDGLGFTALLDEMLAIARRRHEGAAESTVVFESWMLARGGTKSAG